MRIQCESNAHRSRPHCVVQNRIYALASHHIASRVEQIRGTQCVAQRSVLTVGSRHERACHALFGPYAQHAIAQFSSIRIKTTSGSGLGLIRIGSVECAFSVDALKPDSIWFNAHWVSSVDRPSVSML